MEEKIQRLSEGYDFIEESCGYMPLTLTDCIETGIMESSNGSTFKIIGKACGPFQPCGEFSRNNRLYEQDHWNIQLENLQFQDRIKSRDLLGTIGHHDKKVDDADIAAGIVSHIVTCLEIREDKNGTPYLYGELEILDTPAGRNLKALYEGGANLYVSSRGAGKLLDVPNESYKKVDKLHYFCETFDVVRRPGFLKAKPLYEEASTNSVHESQINELDNKTVEKTLDKRQDQYYDAQAEGKKDDKYEKSLDLAQKRAERNDEILTQDKKGNHVHYPNESIEELKGQISQLTKIVEKVVNDVYEQPVEEAKEVKSFEQHKKEADVEEKVYKDQMKDLVKPNGNLKVTKECLEQFTDLMASTNVSEDSFVEILDMILTKKED